MNFEERIIRRLRRNRSRQLVRDYAAFSPVSHPSEPVSREAALERLLDTLQPAFSGELPPSAYVWGPKGAGKTALVKATFDVLAGVSREQHRGIHTTTRTERPQTPPFVYVDAREADSEFSLLAAVLNGLLERPAPTQGVSTGRIREQISQVIDGRDGVVVAVDHLGEPRTHELSSVAETLSSLEGTFVWVGVGRDPPGSHSIDPDQVVEMSAYRRHALVDILSERTSVGLSRDALTHEQLRELAVWADGDAHDALAAVFGGAVVAEQNGHDTILPSDLDAGIGAVPRPCVALGRVLALPTNWQHVLAGLVELSPDDRMSVTSATAAIATTSGIDLSEGTIRRMLYELAEEGILDRQPVDGAGSRGRPPSRIEPLFPTLLFRELSRERPDE
ncbi:cell division control protein 6 [Halalkaliarchaeum desulfuricum]|uniref:Cell division control protein 6 n=1 Tax=Halalkaliarchaeum desulfuricum TaxID=2055893 RepID=A0A343TLY2_9EURY|nr:AAA family ATPase [Halalkaliarchaeum desulfuricum]AUX10104.1 cell division control protein 6 [Halalkaliarchaeum desulfuricum]